MGFPRIIIGVILIIIAVPIWLLLTNVERMISVGIPQKTAESISSLLTSLPWLYWLPFIGAGIAIIFWGVES